MLSYLQLANIENIETWEIFEAQYGTAEERAVGYVKLHSLLRPYIIRRMKKDVEKSLPPKVNIMIFIDKNYQTSLTNDIYRSNKSCGLT